MATPADQGQGCAVQQRESKGGRVLLVDEDPLWLERLHGILEPDGYQVTLASTSREALDSLQQKDIDVAVVGLPPRRDVEVLEGVKRECPDVEVVMITASASIEGAVMCMRGGAFDYLAKPFDDPQRVGECVQGALRERRRHHRRRNALAQEETSEADARFGLVGCSPGMRRLLRTLESLGDNESHVLLQGESGTGKELVARAIHDLSGRRTARFAPVELTELQRRPAATLRKALRHLGETVSGAMTRALEDADREAAAYRSAHAHQIDQFTLDRQSIRDDMQDDYDAIRALGETRWKEVS